MASPKKYQPAPPGKRWVFTKTIRLPNGRVLVAAAYGLECFAFLVDA